MNAVALESAVAAQWDAAAQGWANSSSLVRAWLHPATAALLEAANVQPGMRVLDVAAGAGDQTLDIAHRVGPQGWVLATDISPQIVSIGQAATLRAGLVNVEWRVGDAQAQTQDLGLDSMKFDAAVCRLGLMFCAQPALAVRAWHAALRPAASAAVLVFDGPEGNPCITALAKVLQRHAQPISTLTNDPFAPGTLLSLGRPGLLAQLMSDNGFDDVSIRSIEAPFVLPSVWDYIGFLRTAAAPVMAQWRLMSAAAQHDAWDALAAELSRFTEADGWRGPNRLLLASGRASSKHSTPRSAP